MCIYIFSSRLLLILPVGLSKLHWHNLILPYLITSTYSRHYHFYHHHYYYHRYYSGFFQFNPVLGVYCASTVCDLGEPTKRYRSYSTM